MSREEEKAQRLANLRQQAEYILDQKTARSAAEATGETELKRLIHELQVHQVELEMQNEELMHSRLEAEQSRNEYAGLYDFAPVHYFTLNQYGVIQKLNLLAASLLGADRQLLLHKHWINFVDPGFTEIFTEFFRQVIQTGIRQVVELDIVTTRNEKRTVQLQAVASGAHPKKHGDQAYLLTVTDLTGLKKAEEVSRRASRFRHIIEGIPGIYLFLASDYVVVEASDQYLQTLQTSREAIMGHTISEIYTQHAVHTSFAAALLQSLIQVSYRQKPHTTDVLRYDIPLPDGSQEERYWRITNSPVLSPEGHVTYIVQHMADVTREYTARQEIEKSRRQFEMLALASNDIIWEWDMNKGLWRWSRNLEIQFGYQRSAMEPGIEAWANRIHPDEQQQAVSQLMGALLGGQKEWKNEYRFRRADGSYAFVLDRAFTLPDADGKISRVMGTMVDLTERRQAEEALKESHQRFTLLMETIPQKAWIADAEGNYQFCNRQWLEYTGALAAEMGGWAWQQYIHPEDLPRTLAAWQHTLKTGGKLEIQNRCKRASDGAYRWHMVHVLPVRSQAGHIIQWVGSLTDIHDQKLHEEALEARVQERTLELLQSNQQLKESQQLTRQIVDATPDIVHVYDLAAQKTLYLNYAITSILGYTHEDIENMETAVLQELIHPDDLAKCTRRLRYLAQAATGGVYEMEYRLKDKTGNWHWVWVRYAVFKRNQEGVPRQVIGIIHDITAKKNNEERLKQSQDKLKKLNKALEERVARRTMRLQHTFEQLQREFKERLQIQERFQYALEKSPVILFTQDQDLRYTWIHNPYHFVAGTNIIGRNDTDIFPRQTADAFTAVTKKVLQSGKGAREEVCLEIDGKSYYYDLTVEPLQAADKQLTGIACAAVDITDARIARAELARSEQRYRVLTESIPAMIFMMEPDGKLVYANSWMSRFTGLSSGELAGEGWWQAIHPGDRPLLQAAFADVFRQQEGCLTEVRFRSAADNAYIWHLKRIVPLKDIDGNLTRWIAISTDIHGQKLVEEALRDNAELREAQQKLQIERDFSRSLLDNSIDGIITFDTRLRYTSWNRAVEEMYQISREEAIGKNMFEAFPGYRQTEEGEAIMRVLQGEKVTLYNQPYQDREGFYEINLIPMCNEAGEVTGGLGILHDVTERIKLEEERTSLKLKSQKLLLNAILEAQESERKRIAEALHNGLAQTLYAAKLNVEQIPAEAGNTAGFRESQSKARDLIADAIKETRSISHELVPTILEDFGLIGAIRDFCKKYAHTHFTIHTEIYGFDDRLDKYLEIAIYRIAQELVNNAVKHAGASELHIRLVRGELGILLKVTDNGKGFDAGSTMQSLKGIGLKTIQDRVKLLNGVMTIDAAPGRGASFTIKIPHIFNS
jgi:PAS domain S-box-containing protein